MADFTKHVGKTSNTDRRIVVVYMQIPGREDHALVIDTDALPQRFHDDLMAIVQGEGQHSTVLADILTRRIMPYSGADMLSTLHQAGALQAIPITNVIMLPNPNQGIPLTTVLQHMGKTPAPAAEVTETVHRDNRIVENQAIDKDDQKYQIAANILAEAEMLADEARRKREQAFSMYPALRPVERQAFTVDVPGLTVESAKALLVEAGFSINKSSELVEKPKTARKPAAKKSTT